MIKRTPVISAPASLPAGAKRRGIDNVTAAREFLTLQRLLPDKEQYFSPNPGDGT